MDPDGALDCFMNTNSNRFDRLNLGCGPNAPPNWLNVDGSWNAWLSNHTYLHKTLRVFGVISKNSPGVEWNVRPLVHDLTRPLPFKGNSVAVIYGAPASSISTSRMLRTSWVNASGFYGPAA